MKPFQNYICLIPQILSFAMVFHVLDQMGFYFRKKVLYFSFDKQSNIPSCIFSKTVWTTHIDF